MSDGASDQGRCGRTTRRGGRCTAYRTFGYASCAQHLTAEERAVYDQHRAQPTPFDQVWADPAEPACWRWPVLDVAVLLDIACEGLIEGARALILNAPTGALAVQTWQEDLCAICGRRDRRGLVLDHDHATALIRGYLCRSCNVREAHTGGVFDLYRQRNPATMLGVREQYWNDVAEALNPESLQPTPPPTDRWRKNPAAGIGL